MVLNRLSEEKDINRELMEYGDVGDLMVRPKNWQGMVLEGVTFTHEKFRMEDGVQFAVVFLHGSVTDEQLEQLNLKPYLFPDEIEEIIYVDRLECTTSQFLTLKKRIQSGIFEICRDLGLK